MDGGELCNLPLSKALSENTTGIANARYIQPGWKLSDVIVADDAFPQKNQIMKLYALCTVMIYQRVINYHFSSAWRIAENAFGIFYFFDAALSRKKVVLTSCVLHNFLRDKSLSLYALPRILCKKHCIKYQKIHLIFWYGNFVERCLSAFLYQDIR